MTTIIKIAVVLLVLTAGFQFGRVTFNKYQFEDAVTQVVQFSPSNATDAEISKEVMSLASEYDVPLDPSDITIRMSGADRIVETAYAQDVAFLPGLFSREMSFSTHSSVRLLTKPRR